MEPLSFALIPQNPQPVGNNPRIIGEEAARINGKE